MADDTDEGDNEISPEEQSILLEFQDITGIDNLDECKRHLTRHRWDLQIAVQDALNEAEGRTDVYQQGEESDSDQDFERHNGSGPVIPQAPREWASLVLSVVSFPFQFTFSIISDLWRFIVSLVWPSLYGADTTPIEDILNFKEDFESKYGRTHPTFYEGSYGQAIEDAKKELRFLLVYLHSSEHKDTEQFCRSTLTNEGFKEYVNGNMLFWAADVQSREGYRVSCALRETTYPFMAVICLRDNRMMVVGRLQGLMNVDACVARLTQILQDNEASLIAARAEREERSFNQTLRAEQDAAYLESLRADQEKERRKSLEAETKRLQEEKRKGKEQSLQNKMKAIAEKRKQLIESLSPEPESNDPEAIRIVIRLPHGERMDRYFLKTDYLQGNFSDKSQSPEDGLCDLPANSKKQLECIRIFDAQTTRCAWVPVQSDIILQPAKVFELGSNNDATLEEVGLSTSATLYVQDMTEEDGSEED